MKKAYTFRLDPALVNQLDVFSGNRTYNLELAIQQYIQPEHNNNISYIQHLESEVQYLRSQNDKLLVSSIPILSRIKLKLLSK